MRTGGILLLLVGCHPAEDSDSTTPRLNPSFDWSVDDDRFDAAGAPTSLFTLVAADMDADGDPDVLFQRHHTVRSELFENVGGLFTLVNPRGSDLSGMYDNAGVPDLFGVFAQVSAAIDARTESGLYIWHDDNRDAVWRLEAKGVAVDLEIRVNRPVTAILGVDSWTEIDPFSFQVSLVDGDRLAVDNTLVATQLVVEVLSANPPTMYVGSSFTERAGDRVEVWKNDPHGVAWVDELGGLEPELFVTRGGLTGLLAPPLDPKRDQLFSPGSGALRYDDLSDGMPLDYCRGRQVSWLDVDADGVDELFVACTATPNKLLDRDDAGVFHDVAAAWGLDSVSSETFAWVDVDGDGWLDLVQNADDDLEVLLRVGETFESRPAAAYGLISPVPPSSEVQAVFNPYTLQALDYDRDGDLDVLASHFGDGLRLAVFRNDGGTFVDATRLLGLSEVVGFDAIVPVDVDRDGWIDLYASDATGLQLLRNRKGVAFDVIRLEAAAMVDAVAADVDRDGRTDLIGQGPAGERRVVLDRHTNGGERVLVTVRAPLGTLVRGHYADGSTQLQVLGGWTSRYSQTVGPLEFGTGPSGDRLVAISLQPPGAPEGPRTPVRDARSFTLEG